MHPISLALIECDAMHSFTVTHTCRWLCTRSQRHAPASNHTLVCSGTHLPTIMSSMSEAFLRSLIQMSMVKMVLLLLNIDVSELMSALSITASMIPRAPAGETT